VPAELDAGWSALQEGRWDEARGCFTGRATPDALEGLSWAAWWLDDEAAVFDARERAYHGYRAAGEPASAARMATWLACDELDFHGAAAVASGWLARGHRLLDPLEPCPDHGWLAFFDGYLAHAAGDSAAAGELGQRTAELGRRFDVRDLEMLGLALEGATLVARARVPEGMRRLDEATVAALDGDAAIPISRAWACCFLVTACTAVRDYERAAEWCDRIAEFAARYGSRYMLAFCRAEYGAVDLWHGRWAEAGALLEAAVDDFARSRPAWVGGPLVTLAELRRRQGRPDAAAQLLERAGAGPSAQLCRARLALDAGDPLAAAELADRVLRGLPPDPGVSHVPALEIAVRARAGRGELDAAREAAAALRDVATRVGTGAVCAAADAADGVVAAAAGTRARAAATERRANAARTAAPGRAANAAECFERARRHLEDAVDGLERAGGPYEAALARVELAAALAALDRPGDAARERAAATARLAELGAGAAPPPDELSPREREVLELLADGLTNRQIADRLVLSEHTVHRHVANILTKLRVRSRAAAVARARWPERVKQA
jgi:LuxR family transcriptional regulator, maltose regulon positive regulatory protein